MGVPRYWSLLRGHRARGGAEDTLSAGDRNASELSHLPMVHTHEGSRKKDRSEAWEALKTFCAHLSESHLASDSPGPNKSTRSEVCSKDFPEKAKAKALGHNFSL